MQLKQESFITNVDTQNHAVNTEMFKRPLNGHSQVKVTLIPVMIVFIVL